MPKRGASQTHQNHTIMERSRDRDRRWRSSMVEQLICNQQVAGSSPFASSVEIRAAIRRVFARRVTSRQVFGRVPERSKGTDCKSVATGFEGSNPSPSTRNIASFVASRNTRNVAERNQLTSNGYNAGVAQLVELQPSKLDVAGSRPVSRSHVYNPAHLAQLAEHVLGKDEVTRSIRVVGSRI
jgi:hypothetical protein